MTNDLKVRVVRVFSLDWNRSKLKYKKWLNLQSLI